MIIRKFFIRCIALMLGIAWLTSCINAEESQASDDYVRVVFRVYMPLSQAESRADTEPSDYGTDWEYTIDPSRLHVVFYDQNGKNIGGVERLLLAATSVKNEYQVSGSIAIKKLNLSDGGFTGKIMVFANIDQVDEHADFNELNTQNLTYSYQVGHHDIPMWGVKQLYNIPFQAGKQYNIETIDLLRAEAKVQVLLRQDMKDQGYTLSQVKLVGHNEQGYCLPKFSKITNLEDANKLEHEDMANFLPSASSQPLDLTQGAVYVPEYQNVASGTEDKEITPAFIQLTLTDHFGKSKQYKLKFVDYDSAGVPTANAFDIVRNHYYQYEVYKGNNDILKVNLTVRKWYYVEHGNITM